jgi:GT2 family glycosyltransferase
MIPAESPSPLADSAVELVAVINSFNRLPLLQEALGALMASLRKEEIPTAVVVYEVGSTDGSREFLEGWRRENPGDRLVIVTPAPGTGTSFSDGVNEGCAAALRDFPAARWLLLYETDNWIAGPEPLRQARTLLEARPELAAAGWTLRRHKGSGGGIGYGMRFPGPLSLTVGRNLCPLLGLERPNDDPWQKTRGVTWRACDVVFTSPLLIRRAAWDEAGGFDAEAFPFGDCDLDWAWRCRKLGLGGQSVIQSDAVVHDNRLQASAWSDNRVVDFHRARLRLLRRHRGRWVGIIKPLLFLRHLAEIALLLAAGHRWPDPKTKLAKRREMLRGVWRDYRAADGARRLE